MVRKLVDMEQNRIAKSKRKKALFNLDPNSTNSNLDIKLILFGFFRTNY